MRPALALLLLLSSGCREKTAAPVAPAAVLEGKPGITPAGKTLPEAWLAVRGYADGHWVERGSFATRQEAEQQARKPQPVEVAFTKVVKDSPKERICVDGRNITRDLDLSVRENWIGRHESLVGPFASKTRDAWILTWTAGDSDEILRARCGGPAPRHRGDLWPVCSKCRKPMSFIGSIDFRDTPLRDAVPGDVATLHRCETVTCSYDIEYCSVSWLKAGEDLVLVKAPAGTPVQPTELGTRWLLKDYPWHAGMDGVDPPQAEKKIFGHSPYFHVTLYGTKIGGIPFWIQNDETPSCACGGKMRNVGQIDSSGDGPMGLLYIFRCAGSKCADTKYVLQCF